MEDGETKICQNCKREIPVGNFTIHSVHCTRNVRLCPICKEPVLLAELERHNEKQHKQLPCRQCSENVSASDMEDHIRDSCDFTIRACRFCELELTRRDMLLHESYCGTRTEQCPDCREWVMLKYRQLHIDSNHGFLRLDDDPAPNNQPQGASFALNRPVGLLNTRHNNRPQTKSLVRNINLLEENMFLPMHSHMPGASNNLEQDNFVDSVPFLPPPRRPFYSRPHTFNYAFSQDLQRQSSNNINEAQPKNVVNDNKNTPASRGAVKKRIAPKPPPSSPTSPTITKSTVQGAKISPEKDVSGPGTSVSSTSAGAASSQPKPNDALKKSPNASVKIKKVHNRLVDDQQRKNIQSQNAGPSNKIIQPKDQQAKAKMEGFKNFKPMSTEEFMNRVKELQKGKDCKEREDNAVKEDRFNDIKHSLKELRRELKEVTAPLNNNMNANNNIIENVRNNGMREVEALVSSSSEEDEGAAGGGDGDGAGNVRLPCEFCGAPVLADDLVQHQTGCRPDLARYSPPLRRANEPVIPCEFCAQSLPVYLISEHQERCGREANLLFPD